VSQPKIALFDIETAPSLGYFWGKLYETDIIEVDTPWYMLCFSYKWLGEKKIHTHSLRHYPGYKRDLENDRDLVGDLHKLFDAADILIAHNGDRFDIRKSNARFLKHGMKPPSRYRSIDTLKIARSKFLFDSSRLDALGKFLGFGGKQPHTGFDLWKRVMLGEKEAWEIMEGYNRRDLVLLEAVYNKLAPYATTLHPNLTVYNGTGCPRCQSNKICGNGWLATNARRYHRLRCQSCGHSFQGQSIDRAVELEPND
jgi:DNA polymerase elongation subunit (family B)